MAYVNAEYQHPKHEITLSVLEPTPDENSYKQGMRVDIECSMFLSVSPTQLRSIGKWFAERADFIEKNFNKKGQPLTP